MKFLVMTDIEGVTGVTTFPQAENSEFGRRMLMNDLKAVLEGIREAGGEAIVFDGTIDEWSSVIKYPSWDENTGDYVVTCTDGRLSKETQDFFN